MEVVGNMSNYLITELLKAVTNGQSYTGSSQLYLALYTSEPTVADSGTEVSGTNYTRQVVNFSTPAANNGIISVTNSNKVEFGVAESDYGMVTHIGIRDAVTDGNLLFHAALTDVISYGVNTSVLVQPNDLIVYIT